MMQNMTIHNSYFSKRNLHIDSLFGTFIVLSLTITLFAESATAREIIVPAESSIKNFHFPDLQGSRDADDIIDAYNELNRAVLAMYHQLVIFKDVRGNIYVAGVREPDRKFVILKADVEGLKAAIAEELTPVVKEQEKATSMHEANLLREKTGYVIESLEDRFPSYQLALYRVKKGSGFSYGLSYSPYYFVGELENAPDFSKLSLDPGFNDLQKTFVMGDNVRVQK